MGTKKEDVGTEIKRGSAELAILAVLESSALHGYEIAKRIEQTTHGVLRFDVASLYPLLYRLEKRKWITGQWETTGGRKRRCYQLTPEGRRRLVPLRAQWRMFFEALNRLAGVADA
jgi:DNA-binding PadR family transcriptional regulator